MYLLDTNIVSLFDPRRRERTGPATDWMRRNDRNLFLSTVTLFEIEARLPELRRERNEARAYEIEALRDRLARDFTGRLLAVDAAAALAGARIAEAVRPSVIDRKDLLIAASTVARGLTVLTRAVRRFAPIAAAALDPLHRLPPECVG